MAIMKNKKSLDILLTLFCLTVLLVLTLAACNGEVSPTEPVTEPTQPTTEAPAEPTTEAPTEEVTEAEGKEEVIWECADLLYFLNVLMCKENVTWKDVMDELDRRHKK
jgi:hypothetical protein